MPENGKLPSLVQEGLILDDQGGQQINVRTDGKSPTLRAEAHGNVPCVMAFDGYNDSLSEKSPTLGVNCGMSTGRNGVLQPVYTVDQGAGKSSASFHKDISPTLACTHDGAPAVCYSIENHPADSRVSLDTSGKCQTLTGRMGTGGGNVPMVMEPFCKSRRAKSPDDATTWKHAKVANTLNTFDQGESRANELVVCIDQSHCKHQVVNLNKGDIQSKTILSPVGIAPSIYAGECRYGGGECYVLDKVYCLQGNGIDRADIAGCNGRGWREDVSYTLNTIDRPAVALCIGNGQVDQLKESELVGALNCMHDQQALICEDKEMERYIVRRLTPTECCRLQGFPDGWANIDHKDDFSEEECKFWAEVRSTYEMFNGKQPKEYTKEQLLSWYNKLHTDSAEYKMWGNGIALPTALYVMQGIAEELEREEQDGD